MAISKVRIELNKPGIGQFLKDQRSNPKMLALLESEGRKIASRAGPGFDVKRMEQRQNRPGVRIYPETRAAKQAQARENRLGRALGGG
ncbi:hypothetical protein FYJ24_06855 [Actinomycetaceae bacterium WB03_NA08]|uniref:Uncharacterized protein n=1 Tax=Scrofimicrobium canadense TaxID=2652290 RepID=A0A6N7W893_9ACTO|nr:hypothetical protein [Scrofimicrobium canadense]MSS84486.1 hypothetical protein [Scrofimicrobium canadense]